MSSSSGTGGTAPFQHGLLQALLTRANDQLETLRTEHASELKRRIQAEEELEIVKMRVDRIERSIAPGQQQEKQPQKPAESRAGESAGDGNGDGDGKAGSGSSGSGSGSSKGGTAKIAVLQSALESEQERSESLQSALTASQADCHRLQERIDELERAASAATASAAVLDAEATAEALAEKERQWQAQSDSQQLRISELTAAVAAAEAESARLAGLMEATPTLGAVAVAAAEAEVDAEAAADRMARTADLSRRISELERQRLSDLRECDEQLQAAQRHKQQLEAENAGMAKRLRTYEAMLRDANARADANAATAAAAAAEAATTKPSGGEDDDTGDEAGDRDLSRPHAHSDGAAAGGSASSTVWRSELQRFARSQRVLEEQAAVSAHEAGTKAALLRRLEEHRDALAGEVERLHDELAAARDEAAVARRTAAEIAVGPAAGFSPLATSDLGEWVPGEVQALTERMRRRDVELADLQAALGRERDAVAKARVTVWRLETERDVAVKQLAVETEKARLLQLAFDAERDERQADAALQRDRDQAVRDRDDARCAEAALRRDVGILQAQLRDLLENTVTGSANNHGHHDDDANGDVINIGGGSGNASTMMASAVRRLATGQARPVAVQTDPQPASASASTAASTSSGAKAAGNGSEIAAVEYELVLAREEARQLGQRLAEVEERRDAYRAELDVERFLLRQIYGEQRDALASAAGDDAAAEMERLQAALDAARADLVQAKHTIRNRDRDADRLRADVVRLQAKSQQLVAELNDRRTAYERALVDAHIAAPSPRSQSPPSSRLAGSAPQELQLQLDVERSQRRHAEDRLRREQARADDLQDRLKTLQAKHAQQQPDAAQPSAQEVASLRNALASARTRIAVLETAAANAEASTVAAGADTNAAATAETGASVGLTNDEQQFISAVEAKETLERVGVLQREYDATVRSLEDTLDRERSAADRLKAAYQASESALAEARAEAARMTSALDATKKYTAQFIEKMVDSFSLMSAAAPTDAHATVYT